MEKITPAIEFSTELADLFDLSGKVAYLPGGVCATAAIPLTAAPRAGWSC
jgi:hypothetical protein